MNTSDVLNRAADLIEERGWTAGTGWVRTDLSVPRPLCLEGGIQAALGVGVAPNANGEILDEQFADLWACPAYVAVKDYLALDGGLHLYNWNDRTPRTATEVIEVLRAAALIEQAKENASTEVAAERVTVTA